MLPRITCGPISASCIGLMPLTVPWVPTGMNAGVSTRPWPVSKWPARAGDEGSEGESWAKREKGAGVVMAMLLSGA